MSGGVFLKETVDGEVGNVEAVESLWSRESLQAV